MYNILRASRFLTVKNCHAKDLLILACGCKRVHGCNVTACVAVHMMCSACLKQTQNPTYVRLSRAELAENRPVPIPTQSAGASLVMSFSLKHEIAKFSLFTSVIKHVNRVIIVKWY